MLKLEKDCEQAGIPASQLMENAGRGMAEALLGLFGSEKRYLFVCGSGNNGGDGFAAARILHQQDIKAFVFFCSDPSRMASPAKLFYERLPATIFSDDFAYPDILIDCLLGTGLNGKIREPVRSMIQKINTSGKTIVSCDVPSGMHPDTGIIDDIAVHASLVLCMHDVKKGIDTHKYKTIVIPIGIPPWLSS